MLKKVLLFCLVLCLPSLAWGQMFNSVLDSSVYPASPYGSSIPLKADQAVIEYKLVPRGNYNNIVSVRIIPNIRFSDVGSLGSYGWSKVVGDIDSPDSYQLNYQVIDASNIYGRTAITPSFLRRDIQLLLDAQNLGSVSQRAALIRGFHSGPVQILDIDNFKKSILNALSPFLNLYLGIFLTLFVVDLMTRKSTDVIAESAKIQRRAERAQQRREIRADPTAQIFEFRLANFSSIASGSILDPSISRSKARRLFEDTALEYAEYKMARGWKY